MAESVSAEYELKLKVDHTVALGITGVDDPTLTYDIGDHRGTLNASSTITATKAWEGTFDLAAGTYTLDFTALDAGTAPNISLTGLKLVLCKISCPSTNTLGVTVDIGGADPYDLFGDATGQVTVNPGTTYLVYLADQAETCDATHKDLLITSLDLDATISFILVAGG